ncbi:glycoside hydrolase [Rhodopirellula sp.]|nr:glycoside hydrolase [Rhodopirellula sp.]MDA7914899.1 glycoside hydrolase [bacterium]
MRTHSLSFMMWNMIAPHVTLVFAIAILSPRILAADQAKPSPVALQLESLGTMPGSDRWDWWQARTAYIPGRKPMWLTTMSETGKGVSHDFHDIYQSISHDHGQTWSAAKQIPSLQRQQKKNGYQVAAGDLWPTWHAATESILATGKTFNFRDGEKEEYLRERVSYAVMKRGQSWEPLQFLVLPDRDHAGNPIIAANAGCTQRYDLPNGDILLPIRYQRTPKVRNYTSTIARCSFDGQKLRYQQHGSELNIPTGRGLYEPSLTEFAGKYYLTLRADDSAFVTSSNDGLHFGTIKEWDFDDGTPLGSYNTQQHWVTIGGALFLVYTRRGADNDHIMRHRAPLFIGQVNPETRQVMRDTERVLIQENGATLGNSGVCRISETESWVTCGEGLLRLGKRKGQNNKVIVVKITTK